jgi:hypothetical protein
MALVESYSRLLERKIVDTVAKALADLQNVSIEATEGEATFAVNRRTNREAEVADRMKAGEKMAGPVDHSIPMLLVRGENKTLRAIVFGYACHNTTLAWYRWCGDYAGFAQLAIEKEHPGVQAMFYTGCGADQNPLPRRELTLCQKYGEQLAAGVELGLKTDARSLKPELKTTIGEVTLPFERVTTAEEIDRYKNTEGMRGRWAGRLAARRAAGETFAAGYPYTVQVWKLGDQLWISLAGEVVVDYAIRFRREFGPKTWVASYAHDLVAYIPSRRVWEEGGYEGGSLYEYGLPAERWSGEVENLIAGEVARQVNAIK